jgi:hypothetical protein
MHWTLAPVHGTELLSPLFSLIFEDYRKKHMLIFIYIYIFTFLFEWGGELAPLHP